MQSSTYDLIGQTYDHTRQPDSRITQILIELLQPDPGGDYLDLGCGSGNYTQALYLQGIKIEGLDISEVMLDQARTKNPRIIWHVGDAHHLPFSSDSFDGVTCILATHHMISLHQVFQEVYRILKRGRFVILTSTPEQMNNYWLCHYFPSMIKKSSEKMLSLSQLKEIYANVGFKNIQQKSFFVPHDLTDLFLQAGKYRPKIYLDPIIRSGISSFALDCSEEELRLGLEALMQDCETGKIQDIIQSYEKDTGDYLFIAGEKC